MNSSAGQKVVDLIELPVNSKNQRPPQPQEAVKIRCVALFCVLCVIKFLILFALRQHLFEIHWRIGGEPMDWINHAAFYLFAILAGTNLWMFGTGCMANGVRATRAANA